MKASKPKQKQKHKPSERFYVSNFNNNTVDIEMTLKFEIECSTEYFLILKLSFRILDQLRFTSANQKRARQQHIRVHSENKTKYLPKIIRDRCRCSISRERKKKQLINELYKCDDEVKIKYRKTVFNFGLWYPREREREKRIRWIQNMRVFVSIRRAQNYFKTCGCSEWINVCTLQTLY